MPLSNDERGWVMTCLSGIACVVGASIICIDVLVRQFPGKKDFRIQDSDTFLSASLSLSFGVMLFSALYSMLPSAKRSLIDADFTPKEASWILIACFLGGVVGIQIISRVMHSFIPSHAVDCDHTHEDEAKRQRLANGHAHKHHHEHDHERPESPQSRRKGNLPGHILRNTSGRGYQSRQTSYPNKHAHKDVFESTAESEADVHGSQRRPPLHERVTTSLSQLASGKPQCDSSGPCHGFSDPCGHECFKNVNARGGFRAPARTSLTTKKSGLMRVETTGATQYSEITPLLEGVSRETPSHGHYADETSSRYLAIDGDLAEGPSDDSSATLEAGPTVSNSALHKVSTNTTASSSQEEQQEPEHHHHHVPSNAFLSIGLQTSIAIALHKLPEGFITYATNHANPSLGVAVFLALFIHNITEGFAMALPLYLAINSRVKAMAISFVLGGLSQPIGAAVAAIWFKIAGQGDWAPSEGIYGGMFAVTAGIMASVALQLFSESLDLTHSRMLCMVGAFSGMAILGISSALTA